jgi:hypothetical protein
MQKYHFFLHLFSYHSNSSSTQSKPSLLVENITKYLKKKKILFFIKYLKQKNKKRKFYNYFSEKNKNISNLK